MLYTATFGELIGRVRMQKPSIDSLLAGSFLNERVRSLLDLKQTWSGMIKRGVISIPAAYRTGSLRLTVGSTTVTGSSTSWPTNDVVNTTSTQSVLAAGAQWITPASMSGINDDTVLYVDAAVTPEIVAVQETTSSAFLAKFLSAHATGFTLTASSLAGRQLRMANTKPTFTIRAVESSTSLVMDNPWGETSISGQSYEIVKIYYTLSSDVRELLAVVDAQQGQPIEFHVPQEFLNYTDPQRSSTGDPRCLADFSPNENGNMQVEVYPVPTSARQLGYMYYQQWPKMKAAGDRPPSFINPDVFLYGALSDAFRTKVKADDPFYDISTANHYEGMFRAGAVAAAMADNTKYQVAYDKNYRGMFTGAVGSDYYQNHAISLDEIY